MGMETINHRADYDVLGPEKYSKEYKRCEKNVMQYCKSVMNLSQSAEVGDLAA